jgi:hypothetical protein
MIRITTRPGNRDVRGDIAGQRRRFLKGIAYDMIHMRGRVTRLPVMKRQFIVHIILQT